MKTKRPGNSGGNRRHENMVDSARPEACRSPGPGVCNMGETSTTGRHKWLLPRMAALSAASLGPRELQSPKPQSQKPRARERVNSKRSLRTCTIQECRADSLESRPCKPIHIGMTRYARACKGAPPHCVASISEPNAHGNTCTSQSRASPCNTRRNPPANVRINGAPGESCATSRDSEIPPNNYPSNYPSEQPNKQPARTHPALFQGNQPESPIRSS